MKRILPLLILTFIIALSPIPALAAQDYEEVTITVLDNPELRPPASEEEITITVLDAPEPLPPNQEEISISVVDHPQPFLGSIKINNDNPYTNSTSVVFNLLAQDQDTNSPLQMQFSNNGSTWSIPEAYAATKNWALTLGNAQKTVYVKFKDKRNNWSDIYSDIITLDTSAPKIIIIEPQEGVIITDEDEKR